MRALHRLDLAHGIRFDWKPDFAFMAQTSMRGRRRSKRGCHGRSRRHAAGAARARAVSRAPRSSSGSLNTVRLAIGSACGPRDGHPCVLARLSMRKWTQARM